MMADGHEGAARAGTSRELARAAHTLPSMADVGRFPGTGNSWPDDHLRVPNPSR